MENRGYLREGYMADLVVVAPSMPWTVKPEDILSSCGWSPFQGRTFTSRVTHTFVNGNLVFRQGEVLGEPMGQRLTFDRS
jgi:dihydroorotase